MGRSKVSQCMVAKGNICSSVGSYSVHMQLKDKIKVMEILIVPDLQHKLIHGIDFWQEMKIIPSLSENCWHFSKTYNDVVSCSFPTAEFLKSESELTKDEEGRLYDVIRNSFEIMVKKLGCCKIFEHDIITNSVFVNKDIIPYLPICKHIFRRGVR